MEEDERREASISSNPCLGSNFKSSGITQDQLSKFRELQRRRLQVASKSKFKKKRKGPSDLKGKFSSDLDVKGSLDENTDQGLNESSVSSSSNDDKNEISSLCSQVDVHPALRKKKLHWGLDTKERWERKANM